MLAPYPDRLRSSRSTSAQPNAASRSTPPTTTSSSSQHRLFASRSSIPLTRSRTNSLSSPSPVSNHSDSPSTSPDFILPTSLRNATRRPHLLPRPSTSSGVPDQKHTTSGPATVTSPFSGSVSVPPFADFIPARKRSTKKSSSRKESIPSAHSKGASGSTLVDPAKRDARFSTADRAILEELKLGAAARESQFKMKGNKKHHAYPANEAPYPCNYERPVIDHDVWDTGFIKQLSASHTFHVFETPPTKVLDLGCGSGYWILECAKLWRNCEFVGLDLVPLHPDLSHLRSSDLGSRITWVQANCLEGLPFPNEEFDFVHIKRLAHGIPEDKWDFLLEEISRVMKPGAAIEMIEEDLFFPGPSPDPPQLSPEPIPLPYFVTPPTSNCHLPDGQHHNVNDQRSFAQYGSGVTLTATATGISTLPTSIRNTTDTTNPPSDSADLLYCDSSRPVPGAPLNPRDHSLLEYIYSEMHASRFINLSPLSLLANSLPVYFNNVRSHAPILFMFPPPDLARIKQQLSLSTDERDVSEGTSRSAQQSHKVSGKTTSATLIGGRQVRDYTQQYVILDESAVAPGTIKARQKASCSSSHLPFSASSPVTPTQNNFSPISAPVSLAASLSTKEHSTSTAPTCCSPTAGDDTEAASWLNTLPNQRLKFDLQSLNLHLSTRVTEILACTEAMWEWVCEYQDVQWSHRGQQTYMHNAHSGERSDAHRFSTELVGMSRAEFDVLLTRFELDMRDCINIQSRITSTFHAPAPALALTNDRKAFNNACEKWEEYQIQQRERHGVPPKEGNDPSAAGLSVLNDKGSTGQRLSRSIRVFCAWKGAS